MSAMLSSPSYFNPRSSCEERRDDWDESPQRIAISIHAPHARSDLSERPPSRRRGKFQSTLLMRGATIADADSRTPVDISIHAPHARSDAGGTKSRQNKDYFNPRSSCEERRGWRALAMRRAYFNPRSSCEERRRCLVYNGYRQYFNPRSSCEERRQDYPRSAPARDFNPRSSCEERLMRCMQAMACARHFNPRSSCEERRFTSSQLRPPS